MWLKISACFGNPNNHYVGNLKDKSFIFYFCKPLRSDFLSVFPSRSNNASGSNFTEIYISEQRHELSYLVRTLFSGLPSVFQRCTHYASGDTFIKIYMAEQFNNFLSESINLNDSISECIVVLISPVKSNQIINRFWPPGLQSLMSKPFFNTFLNPHNKSIWPVVL